MLEVLIWRVNFDWVVIFGYDYVVLVELILVLVGVVVEVCSYWCSERLFLIGGIVGFWGDGYCIDSMMDIDMAVDYYLF